METEGSLLHSQKSANWPCSEPDQFSPSPPSHFSKIHFSIIFLSIPEFSKWILYFRCSYQNPVCISSLPHTC